MHIMFLKTGLIFIKQHLIRYFLALGFNVSWTRHSRLYEIHTDGQVRFQTAYAHRNEQHECK